MGSRSNLVRLVAAGLAAVLAAQTQASTRTANAASAAVVTAAAPAPPHGPVFLPDEGALFGAYVPADAHTGPDRRTAEVTFEQITGRPISLERVFHLWDEPWPDADVVWSRDRGRTLVLSCNSGRRYRTLW
ncbi:MAG: hypothetical protein ACRDZU_17280 [Acidimicrobiales bacterium]